MSEKQHEPLDERDLHQNVTQANRDEIKQAESVLVGSSASYRQRDHQKHSTATTEMISTIPSTATPRFTFQSIPRCKPWWRNISLSFTVKKKNGALSVTGATLYAYCPAK